MFCRVHTSNPNIGNNFTLAAKVNTVRNYSLVISFILRSATLKICRVPQSFISNVHVRCWKLEGMKTLWRFVIKCSLLLTVEKAPRKVRKICSFLEVWRRWLPECLSNKVPTGSGSWNNHCIDISTLLAVMAHVGQKCPVSENKIILRVYQVINKIGKIAGFLLTGIFEAESNLETIWPPYFRSLVGKRKFISPFITRDCK